jgi:hypothetical protein
LSNTQVKVQRLLKYILAGFLIAILLQVSGWLFPETPMWQQKIMTFFFGIIIWLDWNFGIFGSGQTVEGFIYCAVVGGIVGLIQVFINSRRGKIVAWVLFISLFVLLNYISRQDFSRDMEKLGSLYGKKLRDDLEFAREFTQNIKDQETRTKLLEFLERDHNKRYGGLSYSSSIRENKGSVQQGEESLK